jgi:hypothetical protein
LWTEDISDADVKPKLWALSRWFNVALMGLMAWALFNCPGWLGNDPWMPKLGENIAAANISTLGGWLWAIAFSLAILCIMWRNQALWLVNAIVFLVFIGGVLHPAVSIVDQERQLPLRELAKAAVAVQHNKEDLIMIGFRKPSLVFYTQQHVEYLEQPQQLKPYLVSAHPTAPLIITTPTLLSQTGLKQNQYQILQSSGVYTLVHLVNQP